MTISWYSTEHYHPTEKAIKDNRIILTYTPGYEDESKTYRLVSAQFVKKCSDVTHWSYLEPPKVEEA